MSYPISTGGVDFTIAKDAFHQQFVADVPAAEAVVMAAAQRPVTQGALTEGLPTTAPAWRTIPSWFVFGSEDRNIPAALHRYMAERAGSRRTREITGASHALSVSRPDTVTAAILDTVSATTLPEVALRNRGTRPGQRRGAGRDSYRSRTA